MSAPICEKSTALVLSSWEADVGLSVRMIVANPKTTMVTNTRIISVITRAEPR
jgi:hypothetical protein